MKARTNCTECRKKIYKEAETEYLKHEYRGSTMRRIQWRYIQRLQGLPL